MKKKPDPEALTEKVQIRITYEELRDGRIIAEEKKWSLSQVFREAFNTVHRNKDRK